MAEKDLSEKELEAKADVFADIVNSLVYEGEPVLHPEHLYPAGTVTHYPGLRQNKLLEQLQDQSKYDMTEGEIHAQYMLANQTESHWNMALREFGYLGGAYREQAGEKLHQTYPVIGLVLNWGKHRWQAPRSLKEIFRKAGKLGRSERVIDDLQLRIYDMRYLPPEVRQRFTSDMRIIVDYLAEGENYQCTDQPILHIEAVCRLLEALTGDIRYTDIMNELLELQKRGGQVTMCPLLDKYENRGFVAGKIESILELLSDLGTVPQEVRERIQAETDSQILSSWHKSSAHAGSIQEFRALTGI